MTDIETECNGLLTYDRKVRKIDAQIAAEAHRGLFQPSPAFATVIPTAEQDPAIWRFTFDQPGEDWPMPSFEDKNWGTGPAAFGSSGESNKVVRTPWKTNEIWMRREFSLKPEELQNLALKVLHEADVEVYLNGILALRTGGRNSTYDELDIRPEAAAALKSGPNLMAVRCRASKTGAYIDVGIAKEQPAPGVRLNIEVFDRPVGKPVPAKVTVTDASNPGITMSANSYPLADATQAISGQPRTAGMRRPVPSLWPSSAGVSFRVPNQRTFVVEARDGDKTVRQFFTTGINAQDRLVMFLSGVPPVPKPVPTYHPLPVRKQLKSRQQASLESALSAFFQAPLDRQATWTFPADLDTLLLDNEPAVRQAAWTAYRAAPTHGALKQDFDQHEVRFEQHLSPYTVKTVGQRPAKGWALFIAMHGGGGAPQALNDQQWRVMQSYYRDHPEAGGYLYVALRAPNNEWNGFYTGYAYRLIQNLLRQFLLFGDVDPNKLFIMGYSHGGYGAFAIGPKMPDRFAAIHSSAAAPADGAGPITLKNTVFSCMVGGEDTMYGRYDRIKRFAEEVRQLRGNRTDIYPVSVSIIADHPHSRLPDRDKIAEMYDAVRNPVPRELTWRLSDGVIEDFFWLRVPAPRSGTQVEATCRDNRLVVKVPENLETASALLDSRLINFAKPVAVELNGKTTSHRLAPSLRTLCETLQRRGDPELAFTVELKLTPEALARMP